MSNNKVAEDSNEWINWIEEAISKKHMKYYEYKDFYNVEQVSNGKSSKVYRANWKNSKQYFALKLYNLDNATVKEIVSEVIIMQYLLCFCLYNIHFLILIYDLA